MVSGNSFDIPRLRGPVPLSHLLLRSFIHPGDRVVDATCGNGHDSLLLAELIGQTGKVWACDIQQQALDATDHLLSVSGLRDRVELFCCGHELMERMITEPVAAVVFNLGYLPGGDHTVTTCAETTLAACYAALGLLKPGGILVISLYPGHDSGAQESRELDNWVAALEQSRFHVWRMGQQNVPHKAPYLLLIQKAG